MNSKLCKEIRKQSKTILVEWFKTLVSEEQSKDISESNILSYLSTQTHIFANNQLHLSAYSYRWMVKKVKTLVRKTNMDVTSVGLKDIDI
jgi:hypothetical protein|tara:strand:- start:368 stop:637 length:270 start_codon:yes stop_codon:yes gene_type:complete